MYQGKTVAVIVPAYNEEKLIGKVLKTIPPFVDHLVVVDDASQDRTGDLVKEPSRRRILRIIYLRLRKMKGRVEQLPQAINGHGTVKLISVP